MFLYCIFLVLWLLHLLGAFKTIQFIIMIFVFVFCGQNKCLYWTFTGYWPKHKINIDIVHQLEACWIFTQDWRYPLKAWKEWIFIFCFITGCESVCTNTQIMYLRMCGKYIYIPPFKRFGPVIFVYFERNEDCQRILKNTGFHNNMKQHSCFQHRL